MGMSVTSIETVDRDMTRRLISIHETVTANMKMDTTVIITLIPSFDANHISQEQ
jgi:hypothetical protein